MEDTYILPNPNSDEFAPENYNERVKIIGTILGFDKKFIRKGNQLLYKNKIVIFFYVHPELSEVFSYGCNINTPNWINYPIELMKHSKKYLKPLGLKLGFNVMDLS